MTEKTANQAAEQSPALAEPTVRVRGGWITGLGLASLGMWMASLTPLQVSLPQQLQDITPHHKYLALALVSAVGAISAVIATPLAGALSDRTTGTRGWFGRLRGRRHRWTLGMAVLAAISLALIAGQDSVIGVAVFWVLFNAFQNGEYASLSAAIPDHVPVRQRATVAGWVGMPQALGLVVGTILVVSVFTINTKSGLESGYVTLAVVMLLLAIPFVLFTADHPLEAPLADRLTLRKVLAAYWISPRKYPDFGWAWLTRFLNALAIAMGTLYLLYFLKGPVHYKHPDQGLLVLILIYTICVVITAVVGGMISDWIGKRKMIVTLSGLLQGVAALLLVFVETWPSAMLAALLFGVGFGAYLAVDQALITQVLPAAADRAKDLGIINIAIVAPSAVGAVLAGALVTVGSYPTLFAGTAVAAALGSILVWRIKSVP